MLAANKTIVAKDSEVGIGKECSTGIELTSTFRDVSAVASLLRPTSFGVYLVLVLQILVDKDEVISIFLKSSWGTPTRRHNSMIRIENGKEV